MVFGTGLSVYLEIHKTYMLYDSDVALGSGTDDGDGTGLGSKITVLTHGDDVL